VALAVLATGGSTIRYIAAAHRIETGRPRTGSGARRAAILLPTARRVRGSKSAARAAIWPAIAEEPA